MASHTKQIGMCVCVSLNESELDTRQGGDVEQAQKSKQF